MDAHRKTRAAAALRHLAKDLEGWSVLAEPTLHLAGSVLRPAAAAWRPGRLPPGRPEGGHLDAPPNLVLLDGRGHTDRSALNLYRGSGVERVWILNDGCLEVLRPSADAWRYEVRETDLRLPPLIDVPLGPQAQLYANIRAEDLAMAALNAPLTEHECLIALPRTRGAAQATSDTGSFWAQQFASRLGGGWWSKLVALRWSETDRAEAVSMAVRLVSDHVPEAERAAWQREFELLTGPDAEWLSAGYAQVDEDVYLCGVLALTASRAILFADFD